MRSRADEIRKRIEKRRRERPQANNRQLDQLFVRDEEKHGMPPFSDFDRYESSHKGHPLIRKEWLIIQVMAAVCLFLAIGIMFKSTSPKWDQARTVVNQVFEKEFQFAAVSNWYEGKFGQPLAILPMGNEQKVVKQDPTVKPVYAVPATGRVTESFDKNGQGIMVQTGLGSKVEAIDEGFVRFAGVKENYGKTVIIQHPDGSESWYGDLKTLDVSLYDFVKVRQKLGEVMQTDNGKNGQFYFAYKKGDSFIDPIQVISFE